MDIVTLFDRFAFPTALAVFLLWQGWRDRLRCEQRHDALLLRIEQLLREGHPS